MQVNLDQLAQQLGTTADKLISAYAKLVPILWYEFFIALVFALLALAFLFFLKRKVKKCLQNEGESFFFSGYIASWVCFALVYLILFGVGVLFLDAVRASASPEAYALDQIFSKIR